MRNPNRVTHKHCNPGVIYVATRIRTKKTNPKNPEERLLTGQAQTACFGVFSLALPEVPGKSRSS